MLLTSLNENGIQRRPMSDGLGLSLRIKVVITAG